MSWTDRNDVSTDDTYIYMVQNLLSFFSPTRSLDENIKIVLSEKRR